MNLVALIGPAQSGKSTLAHHIKARFATPIHFEDGPRRRANIVSFASPIRQSLLVAGISKELHPDLYRKLAQVLGQSCRDHDPNWWIARMFETMQRLESDKGHEELTVIIDDARYANEINLIRNLGGTLIFVDAGHRISVDEPFRAHESETINNILFAELSSRGHTTPELVREHSTYLNDLIWIVRNVPNQPGPAADLIFNLLTQETS